MAIYDSDSQCYFEFNIEFFADTDSDADAKAFSLLNRIFPTATVSLLEQSNRTATALTGSDVTGNNYRYEYVLNVKMGDTANSVYTSYSAASAASALAVLDVNAQRVTGITQYPERVNYLKAE